MGKKDPLSFKNRATEAVEFEKIHALIPNSSQIKSLNSNPNPNPNPKKRKMTDIVTH